jgi:hypothetical protein
VERITHAKLSKQAHLQGNKGEEKEQQILKLTWTGGNNKPTEVST